MISVPLSVWTVVLPTGIRPASQPANRKSGSASEWKLIFVPTRILDPSLTLK